MGKNEFGVLDRMFLEYLSFFCTCGKGKTGQTHLHVTLDKSMGGFN